MACTPSVRLQDELGIKNTDSIHSKEGTLAHEFCEVLARKRFLGLSEQDANIRFEKLKTNKLYNPEMLDCAGVYVQHIQHVYSHLKSAYGAVLAEPEKRYDLSDIIDGGSGISDFTLICKHEIHIFDYKHGQSVKVCAAGNEQLRLYAWGVYSEYKWMFPVKKVIMHVIQPRINNIDEEELSINELKVFARAVREKAEMARLGEGEFVLGEHCRFCPVKIHCKKQWENTLKLAKAEFSNPDAVMDEDFSSLYPYLGLASAHISAVQSYMLKRAVEGHKWAGLKIVEGRTSRSIKDEPKALDELKAHGYTLDKCAKLNLRGITELTKMVGGYENFNKILGHLVIKTAGRPNLVPEDDPRPEFLKAEIEFKDELNENE